MTELAKRKFEQNRYEAELGFWRTRTGEMVHVYCMTDEHLLNTLHMLVNRNYDGTLQPWIDRFNQELKRRAYERVEEIVKETGENYEQDNTDRETDCRS